ncbi:hypothetical protein GCM10027289_17540 [Tsukamurella serpentis]
MDAAQVREQFQCDGGGIDDVIGAVGAGPHDPAVGEAAVDPAAGGFELVVRLAQWLEVADKSLRAGQGGLPARRARAVLSRPKCPKLAFARGMTATQIPCGPLS